MAPRPYNLRIEDPADDPDALAEAIEQLELRGFKVECAALAGQMRRRQRDAFLRSACSLLPGTVWTRCVALEKEIARFEAIQWPRLRDHDAPPEPCSTLRRYLFEARRLGPLPTTPRHLWNITMKCSGPGDFKENPL